MHGDRTVADEQGPGDLPVTIARYEEGQHFHFPVGEVEPRIGFTGLDRLAGKPGPSGEVFGLVE